MEEHFLQMTPTTTTRTVKHLSVTADDIRNGKRGSASWCPVALAVRRLFPDASSVAVDGLTINVGGQGYACNAYGGSRVQEFIRAYDDAVHAGLFWWRKPVAQPFEIDLTFTCRELFPAPAEPAAQPTEQDIDKFEQAIGNDKDSGDPVTGKTDAEIDAGDPGPDPDQKAG